MVNSVAPPFMPSVLLVDDEPQILNLLQLMLQTQGFKVRTAPDGASGVEIYRLHHFDIHLVLLDVMMPGMNGPQTAAAMQQINPALCFCFMTGNSGRFEVDELLGMGAREVFCKPFALESLPQSLRQMIKV